MSARRVSLPALVKMINGAVVAYPTRLEIKEKYMPKTSTPEEAKALIQSASPAQHLSSGIAAIAAGTSASLRETRTANPPASGHTCRAIHPC